MPTEDLTRFWCQNPGSDSYGRRGEDNLLVIDHFGKARHRLLYCRACKARSSEFKGPPFFNSKLPHDKVLAVLEHLAEGCGVRQTARLVGVNKDTVTRLASLAGQHANATLDESLVRPPAVQSTQHTTDGQPPGSPAA